MKLCSKCGKEPALQYHAYCYVCLRRARGQTDKPKFFRDSKNKTLCSHCKSQPKAKGHNYCRSCRNSAWRIWLSKNGGSWRYGLKRGKQQHMVARAYVNHLIRYGVISPSPCEICGRLEVQAHHSDYNQPLNIRWLCCEHHRALHRWILFKKKSLLTEVPQVM